MALLGWGLGRGLLSLAGVGLVFHLGQKVHHLGRRVLELEDEKEKLRDLHTQAMQGLEWIKFQKKCQLGREVKELDRLVRELEGNNKNLMESYSATSQERKCMKAKLFLAEKKAEDYAVLNKDVSRDLKNLLSQKQELESALHCALEKLQRREQELVASSAQKRRLEMSLDNAVGKVIKIEGEYDTLLAQKTQLLEQLKEKQEAFEAYIKEVQTFMAIALEKEQHGGETEAADLIIEPIADVNTQIQKQAKELPARQVETTAARLGDFAQGPEHGGFNCMLEHQVRAPGETGSLPKYERSCKGKEKATGSASIFQVAKEPFETSNGRRKLALSRITSLKGRVKSCFRQGSEIMQLQGRGKGGENKKTEKKKAKTCNYREGLTQFSKHLSACNPLWRF